MLHRLVRPLIGYVTIACALPYLALKVNWLAGGELGVANTGIMRETSMVALNVVTAGMDLVGIAIALAFTHAWGQRVPAWLVLPPAWVAMGLLVRFVLAVPLTSLAKALAAGVAALSSASAISSASALSSASASASVSASASSSSAVAAAVGIEPVYSWVYVLVYGNFVGFGLGLSLAFVLYARVRWRALFQPSMTASAANATHAVQAPLALAAALIAATLGALHIAWACGATLGLPTALLARRTWSSHVINGVDGIVMTAAAIGILMLVHRPRHQRVWLALALTWIGSGFLFSWGLWGLVNVLANTALVRDRPAAMAALNLIGLAQLIAGLVIGVVMLFVLAELTERSRANHRPPASGAVR
jgi:hypothetical protein